MTARPVDPQLAALVPVVEGLAEMFGPNCEVVLHDLKALPHSIVAIANGHVTGRTVGDVPTDLMLRSLRHVGAGVSDVRLYVTSKEGKILKSLAITVRSPAGEPIGVLGINLDVSDLVPAQRALAALTAIGPPSGKGIPEANEVFAHDIREVVATMVTRILGEMGKTPAAMNRDEKMEVVKRLEERGAFLVKRSAEQVAEGLDLSRYTIFSYLKEIRRIDEDANGARRSAGADGPGP